MDKFSICVLGDIGVGKTSVVKAFTQDTNSYESPLNIFTSSYFSSTLEWWDFSGNQKYTPLRKLFYKYFHGYIIVFDLSNKNSYNRLKKWEKEINPWISESEATVMLVGTKEDLGVTEQYSRIHTKVTNGRLIEDDWHNFLARVVATDKNIIEKLNRQLEESKEQDSENFINKLQKWLKPLQLPINKTS